MTEENNLDSVAFSLILVCDHSEYTPLLPDQLLRGQSTSGQGPAVRRGFASKGRRSVVQSKLCALLGGGGLDLSSPTEFAF